MRFAFILCFVAVMSVSLAAEKKPLTNVDVVKMVKAGLPESTIVVAVENSPASYDKSVAALIALKSDGVPPAVIEAMLKAGSSPASEVEPPAEKEAGELLQRLAHAESGGVISVHTFKKLDGRSSRRDGINRYEMSFEARLRFSVDCIWVHIHFDPSAGFNVAKKPPQSQGGGWGDFLHVTQNPGVQMRGGSVMLSTGTIHFEKSESGWKIAHVVQPKIALSSLQEIRHVDGQENAKQVAAVGPITGTALKALLDRAASAPERADEPFESLDGTVATVSPAGYTVKKGHSSTFAAFIAPWGNERTDVVSLVSFPLGLLNRNWTAEKAASKVMDEVRSDHPGAVVTEAFPSKLSGHDAKTFCVTVVEGATVAKKAFTVAVIERRIYAIALHGSAERFDEQWDAYWRVCAALQVTGKK